MRKSKTQKGITLVALIITIVVLLILAAVAISSIKNDGILGYAENAADKYNGAVKDEQGILEGVKGLLYKVLGGAVGGGDSNGSVSTNAAPENVFLWKSNDPSSPDYGTVIGYTANIDNYPTLRFPDRCKKIVIEFSEDIDADTRREMRSYTENIKEVELPETVVEIGDEAFCGYEFSSLKKINIPNNVNYIGKLAFGYCTALKSIIFNGTIAQWNQIELGSEWSSNASIGEIRCLDGTILLCLEYELASDGTYYSVSGISRKVPASLVISSEYNNLPVKEISDNGFVGSANLITIEIPNTIGVIGDNAFAYCSNLNTIKFNGTVEEWKQIELGTDWNSFVPATEVICTNGTVSLIALASAIEDENGNDIRNNVVATNTTAYDEYGNKIVVPAGFKIRVDSSTNYADNVTKGIVIEHGTDGNQFVWVPVGKIYTDTAKTESLAKTITLGRYESFEATNGVYTPAQTAENYATLTPNYFNGFYYTEDTSENHDSSYENAIARDIGAFITSATSNGGYYIGRFEAGNSNGTLVCKHNQTVYNNITQPDASSVCQSMYTDGYSTGTFSSDLVNSYAWDTAIIFIQTFGTKSNSSSYASTVGLSAISTYESRKTGKNILDATGSIDEQLNIYDMAGNCYEWSTETSSNPGLPCVFRGGVYNASSHYTRTRINTSTTDSFSDFAFRPLIYVGL